MSQQNLIIGTQDGGNGDQAFDAFTKIQANFDELYQLAIRLQSKQDVLDNGTLAGDEITLNQGSYFLGNIDLGTDIMVVEGGTALIGASSELSSVTTSSSKATITFKNGGFSASGLSGTAGVKVNNSGLGACVACEGLGTIVFFRNLFSNEGDTGMTIKDASGVAVINYTIVNGGDGIVMTGTANAGPIIEGFNPINCTGKGIDIQGNITSGALRIREANITSVGNAVDISGDIIGLDFSGDAISTTGNGMKVSGAVSGGGILTKTNILSYAEDGMDITGSLWSSFIAESAGITAIAAGKYGLRGDAASANITSAAIVNVSFIDGIGVGGGALTGITKKDLKWSFTKGGPNIVDSRNIGSFSLLSAVSTTFAIQGSDGSITAYADAGGGITTVTTSVAHGLANTDPVSITGTTAYNGLYAITGVTASTFNISRAFVTDEATGSFEAGWTKVLGSTVAGSTIERFDMPNDNELRSLDRKTLPVTAGITVSGSKSGTSANQYQFGLFKNCGGDWMKLNGSIISDFTNRGGSVSGRIPIEVEESCLLTIYARNMDGTTAFDISGFSVEVGLS